MPALTRPARPLGGTGGPAREPGHLHRRTPSQFGVTARLNPGARIAVLRLAVSYPWVQPPPTHPSLPSDSPCPPAAPRPSPLAPQLHDAVPAPLRLKASRPSPSRRTRTSWPPAWTRCGHRESLQCSLSPCGRIDHREERSLNLKHDPSPSPSRRQARSLSLGLVKGPAAGHGVRVMAQRSPNLKPALAGRLSAAAQAVGGNVQACLLGGIPIRAR